jgi:hypothetical protein
MHVTNDLSNYRTEMYPIGVDPTTLLISKLLLFVLTSV